MIFINPLSKKHIRNDFDCGNDELNLYFHNFVSQDVRRRQNSCFVLTEEDSLIAKGFYTLSTHSLPRNRLPFLNIGRRPQVPVYLLGRLAVDTSCQGKGYGAMLIGDAVSRCLTAPIQAAGLVVDMKSPSLLPFYEKNGFLSIEEGQAFLLFPKFLLT